MTTMSPPILEEEEMFELVAAGAGAGAGAGAAADVSLTLPTTRALTFTWSTRSGDLVVVQLLNWN